MMGHQEPLYTIFRNYSLKNIIAKTSSNITDKAQEIKENLCTNTPPMQTSNNINAEKNMDFLPKNSFDLVYSF